MARYWVEYPDLEKEVNIVRKRLPEIEHTLALQVVKLVQRLRLRKLSKAPGIAETLDWATSLLALGYRSLSSEAVERTLGCVLKSTTDIAQLKAEGIPALLEEEF